MKKLTKKLIFLILTTFILINTLTFTVFANENFISIGLTKYKGVGSISLDNNSITLGKENNYLFSSDLSLNGKFTIKPLNSYSIKINEKYNDYNQALNISKNYKDSYIYKEDSYYIMVGSFNSNIEATNFMTSGNINGEVIKLDNFIGIYDNNKLLVAYKDSVAVKSDNYISLSNKQYRNFINIVSKNNSLTVLNILDIEQYLYGVVPSEMPPSWEKEALKAQSVAARNYAYSNKGIHKNEGFDLCDTIHCQVYGGVNNEQKSTNEAIDETKGIKAYYNNELINAVYFSSSGGYTDDAINVWNNDTPYLKAVKDEFEEGGKQWTRTFTFDELSNMASVGTVNEVILENSSITGRAVRLTLVGTNGNKVLEKEEIRTFFSKSIGGSLDSRNFKMAKGNTYISPSISTKNTPSSNTTTTNNVNIYGISSKGNNALNKDNIFVTNKNNNTTKLKDTFVVDKSNNTTNLSISNSNNNTITQNNNNIENVNYASKISRKETNSITFIGKGWGHGVGMSQYGANSLAKKSYKYDEILKYYYTGIEVR